MKISISEAKEKIQELNLKPIMNIWHYSFNFEYFFDHMNFENNRVFSDHPINQWSPKPIFTNEIIKREAKKPGKKPYWMCELTTFEDFLKRRDELSRRKSHFPTSYSFFKKDNLLKAKLVTSDFDKDYFIKVYDNLIRQGHMVGVDLIENLFKTNKRLPMHWIKTIELVYNDEIKAVGLIIDDNKSNSLFNLASVLDKNSWGTYMLSLWVKDCCQKGIKYIDCGISGSYGYYKDAFFLDSIGNTQK